MAMLKRIACFCLSAVMLAALCCAVPMTANAQSGDYIYTVVQGDTIAGICSAYGIDFSANRNLIMSLNGIKKEAELYNLYAGMKIVIPSQDTSRKYSFISGDTVKYYVLPYVVQKGDSIAHVYWLWGLRFENYQEDIKALNYMDNLDLLFVGKTMLLPTTLENVITNTYTTVMRHTMQFGETVYDICSAYNMNFKDVAETLSRYNFGRDVTEIKSGEELLIPLV